MISKSYYKCRGELDGYNVWLWYDLDVITTTYHITYIGHITISMDEIDVVIIGAFTSFFHMLFKCIVEMAPN